MSRAEAGHEMVAIVDRGQSVLRALAWDADHEEQVELAAAVGKDTGDSGLQRRTMKIGASEKPRITPRIRAGSRGS